MAEKGKNSRRQFTVRDDVHGVELSVDSMEEVDMVNWLNEAHALSVVCDFQYQPPSFPLFKSVQYEDVNGKERCLFRDHVYTADFSITFDPHNNTEFSKEFKLSRDDLSCESVTRYVDVKGTFAQHDGGRSFSIN